jgi:hypothetical protein
MGFIRKATIIGTGGVARAGGVRGKSKKERNAEANEKMAKIEGKRFKAEQKVAKAQLKAAKAEQKVAKADTTMQPAVMAGPGRIQTPTVAVGAPPQAPQGPPPGWYVDQDGGSLQRWWDGTQWTEFKQAPGSSKSDVTDVGQQPPPPLAPLRPTPGIPAPSRPFQLSGVPPFAEDSSELPGQAPDNDQIAPLALAADPDEPLQVPAPAKVEPGHLVCDGEWFRFGIHHVGMDTTRAAKLSKLGRSGPIKVKVSKDGALALQLLPGLTLKGLSAELCAEDLAAIAAHRPDVPVETSTPEVAIMLQSAGVVLPIWDHH